MNRAYKEYIFPVLLGLFISACISDSADEMRPPTLANSVSNGMQSSPTPGVIPNVNSSQDALFNRKIKRKLRVPTVINMEDRFINPPEIPEAIVQFVRSIPKLHQDCKESLQAINECFAVVQVDLNEDSFVDFVLLGRGRNGGANVAPFYVLNGTLGGYDLVLEDVKLQLEILEKKSHDFFDIKTTAIVANIEFQVFYSFDKDSYKVKRKFNKKL